MIERWIYDPFRKIAARTADALNARTIRGTRLTVCQYAQVQVPVVDAAGTVTGQRAQLQVQTLRDPMYGFGHAVDEPLPLEPGPWIDAAPALAEALGKAWGMGIAVPPPELANRLLRMPGNGRTP